MAGLITARDSEIRQAQAARLSQDVKILQKVNAAHREAFRERFPGSIEHCLRLTVERMQAILTKTDTVVLGNPDTWLGTPQDMLDLAQAIEVLYRVYREVGDHDRHSSADASGPEMGS